MGMNLDTHDSAWAMASLARVRLVSLLDRFWIPHDEAIGSCPNNIAVARKQRVRDEMLMPARDDAHCPQARHSC